MKTPYEYRAQARQTLQNRWGEAAIIQAVILALAVLVAGPSAIAAAYPQYPVLSNMSTIGTLLILPIQFAFYNILLRAVRMKNENWWKATWQLTGKLFGKFFLAGLLIILISIFAGIITLGIGAIILSYAYSMVPFLLHDYPELTVREAMKISREMMRGEKWNLFILDLTFIGWIILSILTLGIGILFVEPYTETARAAFYNDLKKEKVVDDSEENPIEEVTIENIHTEEGNKK